MRMMVTVVPASLCLAVLKLKKKLLICLEDLLFENRHMSTTTLIHFWVMSNWMQHNCAKYLSKKQSTSYLKYYSDISQRSVAVAIANAEIFLQLLKGPESKCCFAAYSPSPVGGAEAPSAPLTPGIWKLFKCEVKEKTTSPSSSLPLFVSCSVSGRRSLQRQSSRQEAQVPGEQSQGQAVDQRRAQRQQLGSPSHLCLSQQQRDSTHRLAFES